MNKLNVNQGQQLTEDLCQAIRQDSDFMEYIIDEYVYLIDDDKVNELRTTLKGEFGYD